MANAIEVRGVGKRFSLSSEKYASLKERLVHLGRQQTEHFWALHDIDLSIPEGETVGLIGHNGSGKSTLLKCVAGILRPTQGEIRTVGRVAALLELGAGFHPELTGRENVYLNGAILGLSRREIDRRFDDIVGFAELERHIDAQVRNYSSGMYVRLGFAVAVNVDPDVLLVDEVLAVGDEAFQRKCLARVRAFQREGRTIVVVTHAVDLVRQVCSSAAVLDHGNLLFSGSSGEAARVFREHLHGGELRGLAPSVETRRGGGSPDSGLQITGISVEHPGLGTRNAVQSGEPLSFVVSHRASRPIADAEFCLTVYDSDGKVVYAVDSTVLRTAMPVLQGDGVTRIVCDSMPLLDGKYPFSIGVRGPDMVYDWKEQVQSLEVINPGAAIGSVDLAVHFEVDVPVPLAAPPPPS